MVLDRRMFRRPSQMAPQRGPSSKGVGITSGLTQPVQKFAKGDFAQTVKTTREELEPVLREYFPKESFYERAGTSPFKFFAALGSPMQPGQTAFGKIGEAGQYLDIKPEGDPAGELATDLALQAGLKTLEDKDSNFEYKVVGDRLVKIDKNSGKTSVEQDFSEEDLAKFDFKVVNNRLVKVNKNSGETSVVQDFSEEVDKEDRVTKESFFDAILKDGLVQRRVTYFDTEKDEFVTEDVGEPFYKSTEEKINDSVADVDAYIESLKDQINPKTNAVYTQAELDTLRSDKLGEQLSKQKLVLTKEEELDIARGQAAISNDAEISKGIIQNIIETAPQINQQLANVNTAQASIGDATTGAFVPMRNAFAMVMDSFPALKSIVPESFQGNIAEALNTGNLSVTQLLDAVLTQGVLDRAAGGSLKGNYNQKEIDLFIDSGPKILQTKEGIDLLLDLQERQLEILANSNVLLNEFTSNGTINGEPVKDSIAAAFKIKQLESEAFQAYANSEDIQNRIQEALGYGDYRGSDFFLNAEPLVISGNKFEVKDLWQQGRINVIGYADENGSITLPSGTVYTDPNLVTPKQPVYQIRISDEPDKNGLYDHILVSGDQFTKR